MKKLLIAIALACCMLVHNPASAQIAPIQATLNSASTGACSPTSCLAYTVPSGVGSASISVVGSSGTVVFEVVDINGNYAGLNVLPSTSTTQVSSATVTGTQFFQANIAGYSVFRVRLTASGSAAVVINPSVSSARSGGGGGAGAVSSVFTRTGAIVATAADYTCALVTNCLSNAIPTTVSGATSGAFPCFDSATDMNTTAAIGSGVLLKGGGAGACGGASSVTDNGTTVATSEPINSSTVTNGYQIGGTKFLWTPNSDGTAVMAGAGAGSSASGANTQITAMGQNACFSQTNTAGEACTAFGRTALQNATGAHNAALGDNTCVSTPTTGGNNTCLGATDALAAGGDTNETVVGQGVTGAGSNTVTIGNSSVTDIHHGASTDAATTHQAAVDVQGGSSNTFGTLGQFNLQPCEASFAATTVNTGGATTTTGQSCVLANTAILDVVYRITTTITVATGFTVGITGTTSKFCSSQSTLTSGTVGHCNLQVNAGAMESGASALPVIVTFTGGTPGAGAIRIAVEGLTATPPTS